MSVVRQLKLKYEDFQIDIPEWVIPDEGITVLWGPSGSGKTSLFRALIGLEDCPTLSWEYQGQDLAKVPISKRRLGVVFQTLDLFPHMTARENIEFAARARRVSKEEIPSLTAALQVDHCLDRRVEVLSGGEKQRIALIRALIGKPVFLFLDEPFSALDEDLKTEARLLVKKVIKDQRVPTLLITHDPRDRDEMADSLVTMKNGQLKNSLAE